MPADFMHVYTASRTRGGSLAILKDGQALIVTSLADRAAATVWRDANMPKDHAAVARLTTQLQDINSHSPLGSFSFAHTWLRSLLTNDARPPRAATR